MTSLCQTSCGTMSGSLGSPQSLPRETSHSMFKNIRQFTIATTTACAVVVGVAGSAFAGPTAAANPAVTRAALDPALVAGRGASVSFLEQEAEKAATNGTVIGPERTAYSLPAEASGRSAVKLLPGQYVE